MAIRQKVTRAINAARFSSAYDAPANAAITAFLEAAAEEGWRMCRDEATEEMGQQGKNEWWKPNNGTVQDVYRAMLAASPKFEWDK